MDKLYLLVDLLHLMPKKITDRVTANAPGGHRARRAAYVHTTEPMAITVEQLQREAASLERLPHGERAATAQP